MEPTTFWNLTNHTIARAWSEEQRRAASAWGGGRLVLRDYPFPDVDPCASREEVQTLARAAEAGLRQEGGHPGDPVLVMGEFGLVYALVGRLKAAGFVPLAATSRREAREVLRPDGSVAREHIFRFVAFRPY